MATILPGAPTTSSVIQFRYLTATLPCHPSHLLLQQDMVCFCMVVNRCESPPDHYLLIPTMLPGATSTSSLFQLRYLTATRPCRITSRGTLASLTSKQQHASHAGMQPSGQSRPKQMLVLSMQLASAGEMSLMTVDERKRPMLAQARSCKQQMGQVYCHICG